MIFRRSKYTTVIDAQLDLFLREHRDAERVEWQLGYLP